MQKNQIFLKGDQVMRNQKNDYFEDLDLISIPCFKVKFDYPQDQDPIWICVNPLKKKMVEHFTKSLSYGFVDQLKYVYVSYDFFYDLNNWRMEIKK